MKPLLAAAVVVIALALAAAAQAKEPTSVALCGPSACAESDRTFGHHGLSVAGPTAPTAAGDYYRIEIEVDGAPSVDMYYVPARGLMTSETKTGWTQWLRPEPRLARALRGLARQVEPFPAPAITSVRIGGRRLQGDPSSYLDLFEVRGKPAYAGDGPIRRVAFTAKRPSPWTDTKLAYFPQDDVLQLAPGHFYRVPAAVAKTLEVSPPLARTTTDGRPAAVGLAAAVGALAAGAALVHGRRRRR